MPWWSREIKSDEKVVSLVDYVEDIPKRAPNNTWLTKNYLDTFEYVAFDSGDIHVYGYWKAWADWTADFACQNEYTGYSSVGRWKSENPLSDMKEQIGREDFDEVKGDIFDKLKEKAELPSGCPGLRTSPDSGGRISDADWRKQWRDDD